MATNNRNSVETTIQDVLGCAPFTGTSGFTMLRTSVKTWLMRQGWNGKVFENMSPDEITEVYTDHSRAVELSLKYSQPAVALDRGRRFASAPYMPKDSKVIRAAQRKARLGISPIAADGSEEQEDAAAFDEDKVMELIRQHLKPAEVVIKLVAADKVAVVKGTKHPKLAQLAKVMAARQLNGFHINTWLYGPTGSGKTHSVRQIAEAMKLKFYSHGAMSMSHELMGYKDANGKYHTTPFREAYEKGGVCLLDECDSWDQQVTLALNGPLIDGIASFPDGMIKRHKDFIAVAAGNTAGNGATSQFVGRNKLDRAFMSRFQVKLEWLRDESVERAIAGNDAWVERVRAARMRAEVAGIDHAIDPRHSQAGAALIAAGMSMDEAADLTYLAGLASAQRRTVEGI